jgi:hypothetical protein
LGKPKKKKSEERKGKKTRKRGGGGGSGSPPIGEKLEILQLLIMTLHFKSNGI